MSDEALELYPSKDKDPPYAFYIFISITFCIILLGLTAFIFNKKSKTLSKLPPGFSVVDDGKWLSIMMFALQFWDFTSDINLCIEIWINEQIFGKQVDSVMLIIAIGSTLFILIPYAANLFIAARIKTFIKTNEAAKAWYF